MTERWFGIFRQEAVEHHARPDREGDVLRATPKLLSFISWGTIVLFLGCALLVSQLTIEARATLPVVVRRDPRDAGRVVVAVRSAASGSLAIGTEVELELDDPPLALRATVEAIRGPAQHESPQPELLLADAPVLLVDLSLVDAVPHGAALERGARGRAVVPLGKRPLLGMLVPGERAGGDGSP